MNKKIIVLAVILLNLVVVGGLFANNLIPEYLYNYEGLIFWGWAIFNIGLLSYVVW